MNELEDVDANALRDALMDASSAKAAKRLMIALAYADGVRIETLSERYDIHPDLLCTISPNLRRCKTYKSTESPKGDY